MKAADNPGYEFGYALGEIAIPILIVVGGFALAHFLNSKREFSSSVKWPIYVSLVVAVLGVLGQCSKQGEDQRPNGVANPLVIREADGLSATPFPRSSEVSEQELASYTQKIVDSVSADPAMKTQNISGESFAFNGVTGGIIRTELTKDKKAVSIQYLSVRNGKKHLLGCFFGDGSPLGPNDLQACRHRATTVFGKFDDGAAPHD